ncbi:hypothetical protein SDJN02_13670, partial [Cucurbita argyrosperma subsp. argyrosperma]
MVIVTKSICASIGVVLKNARMTKKSKRNVNVDDDVILLLFSLVILFKLLRRYVIKATFISLYLVRLPAGSFSKLLAGCDYEAKANDPILLHPATGAKTCAESFKEGCPINQISDLVQDQNGFGHGALPTVTGKLSDVRPLLRDNVENNQRDAQQKRENKLQKVVTGAAINWRQDPDNQLKKEQDDRGQEFDMRQGLNVDRVQSSLLSAWTPVIVQCRQRSTWPLLMVQNPIKEFKLNPRAKLFYPSVANNMSATPAAPVSYISNNTPVHVPVAQPEVVFSPFVPLSPVPTAKFVPYDNSISGFGGNVAQFSQPPSFPFNHPMQLPEANSFFNAKF